MTAHTHYLWFHTKQRQEIIDITDQVAAQGRSSRVTEGLALVSALRVPPRPDAVAGTRAGARCSAPWSRRLSAALDRRLRVPRVSSIFGGSRRHRVRPPRWPVTFRASCLFSKVHNAVRDVADAVTEHLAALFAERARAHPERELLVFWPRRMS